MNTKLFVIALLGTELLLGVQSGDAAWQDQLRGLLGGSEESTGATGSSSGAVTQGEASSGLREALVVSTQRAIQLLGHNGGFLDDPQVRIPIPGPLRTVEKGLRAVGQGQRADEFIATMNHAAEQAVPQAAGIFGKAIRNMSLQDARSILTGPDNAATNYFREHTGSELTAAMLPIVSQATSKAGVTASYKRLTESGGSGMLGGLISSQAPDLDQYVTEKTLDGLFTKIAAEEKAIRTNPVARSTDLLKKVFGSVTQ